MKNRFILLMTGLSLSTLSACEGSARNPVTPESTQTTPQATPQTTPSTIGQVPADPQGQFTMDMLSREQYVNAMACAAEKAAPGSKFRFKSQWNAYQSPDAEAAFNNAIALGGDGQFILYTQAIGLGCLS